MSEIQINGEILTQEDADSLYNSMCVNRDAFLKMKKMYGKLLKVFRVLSENYINDKLMLKLNGIEDYNETEYKSLFKLMKEVDPKMNLSNFEKSLSIEFPEEILNVITNNDPDSNIWEFSIIKKDDHYRVIRYLKRVKDSMIKQMGLTNCPIIYTGLINYDTHEEVMIKLEKDNIVKRISRTKFSLNNEEEFLKKYNEVLEEMNDFR